MKDLTQASCCGQASIPSAPTRASKTFCSASAYLGDTICIPCAFVGLLDTAHRTLLEPYDSFASVRHGLNLAGSLRGVKTRTLGRWHVAQNLAGLAVQLDYPSWRSGRLVRRLHSRP